MFAVMEILSNWFAIMKIDKHTARFLYVHWQFHTDRSKDFSLREVVSVYWTMTIDLALHWLPCGLSMLLQKLRSSMRLQRHKGGLCSHRPPFFYVCIVMKWWKSCDAWNTYNSIQEQDFCRKYGVCMSLFSYSDKISKKLKTYGKRRFSKSGVFQYWNTWNGAISCFFGRYGS